MIEKNEETVKPDYVHSRPINCDQVAWILNAIGRYLPKENGPSVSRLIEMQKYALLYEIMEVANLYFEDSSAQHNGTPHDVRRFKFASKQDELTEDHNNITQYQPNTF